MRCGICLLTWLTILFSIYQCDAADETGSVSTENTDSDAYSLNERMLEKLSRGEFEMKGFGNKKNDDDDIVDDTVEYNDVLLEDVGKTYKDRFNYASFDCAATIVKTNKEAKSANAVLVDSKDTYLLNECDADQQFVIIELCEDILIDEILIGNYEFYSSMFKDVRISASDRYPVTQWYTLGEFTAENIRRLQTFTIDNPVVWSKYLKVEILSYYGNEFYCPISSIQAHGKTMIEQFKEDIPSVHEGKEEEKVDVKNETVELIDQIPQFDVELGKSFISCFELNSSTVERLDCSARYLKLEQFLNNYETEVFDNEQCTEEDNVNVNNSTTTNVKVQPQDSIYKNIVNRINVLESNASISLRYIEEQSRLLSDAFSNLELNQDEKFGKILKQLNSTIQSQMDVFQQLNVDVHKSFTRLFEYQQNEFDKTNDKLNSKFNQVYKSIWLYKLLTCVSGLMTLALFVYVLMTKDIYIDETAFVGLVGDEKVKSVGKRNKVPQLGNDENSPKITGIRLAEVTLTH